MPINIDTIKELQKNIYDQEKYDEYVTLRESIEERIEQIDNFYELNFDQPYSSTFEKGRIKLKKLLMFKPFQLTQINYANDKNNAVYGLNTINQKRKENEFKANYDILMKGGNNNQQRAKIKSKNKTGENFLPPEAKKQHFRHSAEKSQKNKNIIQNKSNKKNYNKNNVRFQDMNNFGDYNMTINNNSRLYSNKNNGNNFGGYNNSKTTKNKCSSLDKKGINNYYNKYVNSGFSKTALNSNAKNNKLNYNQNFFNE